MVIKELTINRICYTQHNDPQYGMDDHNQYMYIYIYAYTVFWPWHIWCNHGNILGYNEHVNGSPMFFLKQIKSMIILCCSWGKNHLRASSNLIHGRFHESINWSETWVPHCIHWRIWWCSLQKLHIGEITHFRHTHIPQMSFGCVCQSHCIPIILPLLVIPQFFDCYTQYYIPLLIRPIPIVIPISADRTTMNYVCLHIPFFLIIPQTLVDITPIFCWINSQYITQYLHQYPY